MTDQSDYVARVETEIKAPADAVWNALVNPEIVKQYMHDAAVESTWEVGSAITWTGLWDGKAYVDKGEILECIPNQVLTYTHWSPLAGTGDASENYHAITCRLNEDAGTTTLVLTQNNNKTEVAAEQMASQGWAPMLQQLKAIVEA